MKRICLFAGYDPEGIIDDYVIYYLKELSQYADIHYLAECDLKPGELEKISPYTKTASAYRHGKYDFGSWSELIEVLGWKEIEKYDGLILANDSQYLVGDIGEFIESMESENYDFWAGLAVSENYTGGRINLDQFTATREILDTDFTFVSSFLVFSKNLFSQAFIKNFFANIMQVENRIQVSHRYEIGLTKMLIRHDVNHGVFIKDLYSQSSIYKNTAFHFLTLGYPFIKVKVFFIQYYTVYAPMMRFKVIEHYNPKLNSDMIVNHLNRLRKIQEESKSEQHTSIIKLFYKLIRLGLKLLYEITPKFIAVYYKKMIDKFDKYMFETQYFKSKIDYFLKFITTLPAQRKIIKKIRDKKKIIIYLTDARDIINGGILSIDRFVRKSGELDILSDYEIIVSGIPLFNPPLKYSFFEEAKPKIKFSKIVKNCHPDELILHIPEIYPLIFFDNLSEKDKIWLAQIPKLQINILNQNNEMMPGREIIRGILDQITENITITTAHNTYCTQQLSNKYSAPVHQLTPFLPEFYQVDFDQKKKIILVSNDNNLFDSTNVTKTDIINRLRENLPEFQIKEIQNLGLQEYKKQIANALFTISFGEGFDGYFLEPILSKSLSFAVFNPFYFPAEFLNCDMVYKSWDDLFENIINDLTYFSQNKSAYEDAQTKALELIHNYISNDISTKELVRFYKKEYDFKPDEIEYSLFNETKTRLQKESNFKFFGGKSSDEMVLAPDGNVFLNMRGDFYSYLNEIYCQKHPNVGLEEDFILIDLNFCAGLEALNLLKKHQYLKKIYGFEPILPIYRHAVKNINNNHADNRIIIKPLGLGNNFEFKKVPYIPDWSCSMSIHDLQQLSEMYSTSEMKDKIRYVETEVVPAHTELEQIILASPFKIMMKCVIPDLESKLLNNLEQHNLLHKIDKLIISTHKDNQKQIVTKLVEQKFYIESISKTGRENIIRIIAVKENEKND